MVTKVMMSDISSGDSLIKNVDLNLQQSIDFNSSLPFFSFASNSSLPLSERQIEVCSNKSKNEEVRSYSKFLRPHRKNAGMNDNTTAMRRGPYAAAAEKMSLQREIVRYRSLLSELKPHFEELQHVPFDGSELEALSLAEIKNTRYVYKNKVAEFALKLPQSDFLRFIEKLPQTPTMQEFKADLMLQNRLTEKYWRTRIDELGKTFEAVNRSHSSMLRNENLTRDLFAQSNRSTKLCFLEKCEYLTKKLDVLKNRIGAFCSSESQVSQAYPSIPWEKTLKGDIDPFLKKAFADQLEQEISSISHELNVLDQNSDAVSYRYWNLRVEAFGKQIKECYKKLSKLVIDQENDDLKEAEAVYKKARTELASIPEENRGLSKGLKEQLRESQAVLNKLKRQFP